VTLFQDTLRHNLDPFQEHADHECWDVLERCHLPSLLRASSTSENTVTLDMQISQSGSLSAGERQLLALARAILRGTNVIILDEATSQIDSDLDERVSLRS
jgi:ABC-type multidrug transport system fused ATPase/permease subunit